MSFIHILFIDGSIDRCMKYVRMFTRDSNVLFFDYESNYNEIDNINFDYYDICFLNINQGFQLELVDKHNTIFIAMDDDFAIPENEEYVKEIMERGFDMYVSSILDSELIKHILNVYNLITSKK